MPIVPVVTKYESSEFERGRVSLIRDLIPDGNGRSALDLGCGPGFFTRMLAEKGWRVTAADFEASAIERAGAHAERTVQGDALSVVEQLRGSTFSFILMLELVEHLKPQRELLAQLRTLATSDTSLLISTPNRHSVEGLYGYYWGEKIRRWDKWIAWDPTHEHIFSGFEFLRMLRRTGWRPQKVIGYWYRGTIPPRLHIDPKRRSHDRFPLNRFGFDTIVMCRPHGH